MTLAIHISSSSHTAIECIVTLNAYIDPRVSDFKLSFIFFKGILDI